MGENHALDTLLETSRADTRAIILVSGVGTISPNSRRVGLVIYSPATNPIRIIPGVSSDPGFGGIPLAPGDLPAIISVRHFGDAAKETVIIAGTGSDSVLITELTACPCV